MSGAGEALQAGVLAALRTIAGLGVFEPGPAQAALPYATVDAGFEMDWGHKSGAGREVRLAVTLRDAGERPVRLRRLAAAAEAALAELAPALPGWRLVTLTATRSRLLREPKAGWAAVLEYRARLLAG